MILRPPRSTLFPTRRSSDLKPHSPRCSRLRSPRSSFEPLLQPESANTARRSEEHTSELQSRQYLVCRLLLEKQKNLRRQPLSLLAGAADFSDQPVIVHQVSG